MNVDVTITFAAGLAVGTIFFAAARAMINGAAARKESLLINTVVAYFCNTGVKEIEVHCYREGKKIVLLIQSEPLKKFRFSYIIEQSLIKHVHKTTKLNVERIFWRFPLPEADRENAMSNTLMRSEEDTRPGPEEGAPAATNKPEEKEGLGPDLGLPRIKDTTAYNVDEISWESYEDAIQPNGQPRKAASGEN